MYSKTVLNWPTCHSSCCNWAKVLHILTVCISPLFHHLTVRNKMQSKTPIHWNTSFVSLLFLFPLADQIQLWCCKSSFGGFLEICPYLIKKQGKVTCHFHQVTYMLICQLANLQMKQVWFLQFCYINWHQ